MIRIRQLLSAAHENSFDLGSGGVGGGGGQVEVRPKVVGKQGSTDLLCKYCSARNL